MTQFKSEQITAGDTILERLSAGGKLPGELRAPTAAFKRAHGELVSAQGAVSAAEAARDEALAGVAQRDTQLDRLIERLVALLPAHGLGDRRNPLAAYSQVTASDLVAMAYAKEAAEAVRIASAIKKTKPHKDVLAACDDTSAAAKAVLAAIRSVAGPQRAYSVALGKRDALLPEWSVLRARLERKAIGAWADEPEMVRAFFAPPSAIARPVTKRAPKKDAPAAEGGAAKG